MIRNTMDSNYYVYGHYRKDTDTLFYVGKGKGKRAFSKANRNKRWQHIVDKAGYDVFFFYKGLSEERAYDLEIAVITDINPVANFAPGGPICGIFTNGFLGKTHTDAHKKKMSDLYKGRKMRKMDEAYMADLKKAALVRAKKVLDVESGIIYESIRACARACRIGHTSMIKRVKNGKLFRLV